MTSRASFGRLKLVLRLELPLRPLGVDARPALPNDVRREGGPDPPPVAPVLLTGDMERSGSDVVGLAVRAPFRSSDGMSSRPDAEARQSATCAGRHGKVSERGREAGDQRRMHHEVGSYTPLSTVSVSAL